MTKSPIALFCVLAATAGCSVSLNAGCSSSTSDIARQAERAELARTATVTAPSARGQWFVFPLGKAAVKTGRCAQVSERSFECPLAGTESSTVVLTTRASGVMLYRVLSSAHYVYQGKMIGLSDDQTTLTILGGAACDNRTVIKAEANAWFCK